MNHSQSECRKWDSWFWWLCHQPLVFFSHDYMTQNYTISRVVWTSQWSMTWKAYVGWIWQNLNNDNQYPKPSHSLIHLYIENDQTALFSSRNFLWASWTITLIFFTNFFFFFLQKVLQNLEIASGITIQPPFLISCQTTTHVTASHVVWTAQWSNNFEKYERGIT